MKKIVKLTERDLTRIVQELINEQLAGSATGRFGPGKDNFATINNTIESSGSNTFKYGKDQIDPNNTNIKSIVSAIKKAIKDAKGKNVTITIDGGASAIGSNRGYNNEALAKRRRDNFIDYLEDLNLGNVTIISGSATVGKENKMGDAAEKEQFVKANISYNQEQEIQLKGDYGDNTNVAKNYLYTPPKDLTFLPKKTYKKASISFEVESDKADNFIKTLKNAINKYSWIKNVKEGC